MGLLFISGLVQAQTPSSNSALSKYPARQDAYVNDLAKIFSASEYDTLRTLVKSIAPDFDLTVLTIDGIADYDSREPSIETFSTNLFNLWGVGSQAKNTGVLVVLAIQNRDIRIELGDAYKRDYDSEMKTVIQEYMIPRFKQGNYAQGLTNGVAQIYYQIKGTHPAMSGTPDQQSTASWLTYA